MIAISLIGLIFSYFLATTAFACVFHKLRFPARSGAANFLLAWLLGPMGVAWVLWVLLRFLPGLPPAVYMSAIMGVAALTIILLRERAQEILGETWRYLSALPDLVTWENIRSNLLGSGLLLGAAILFLVTAFNILAMPIMASDPLEYASLSRVLAADRSLDNYPLDPSLDTGFYARSAHPPAFHMMIVWAYFFEGGETSSRLLRIIQLHYLIGSCALMAFVCHRENAPSVVRMGFGVLFLLGTPFYIALVTSFHIDPIRIPLMFLGMVVTHRLLMRLDYEGGDTEPNKRPFIIPALITGLVVGLGMFAHSIGLLLLPFAQSAYFFVCKQSFIRRCLICTVLGLTALFIGAGQFVQNTVDYGVPLHDSEPVWEHEEVDHKTDVRFRRDLVHFEQRVTNGLLVWFSRAELYGQVHWFALIFGLIFWRSIWNDLQSRVYAMGMLLFYALAVLTMSIGVDMVIKNIRYMLTVMPFVVYVAATGAARAHEAVLERVRR